MRKLVMAAAALFMLLSLPAAAGPALPASSCSLVRSQTVNLTGPSSADVVEARSIAAPRGSTAPNCNDATVLLTVRRGSDKAFLYGYISVMTRMDLIEGHAGPPYGPAMVAGFLDEWAKATVGATNDAPAFGAEGISTRLSAQDYAAIRAQKLPMLCHATGTLDRRCLYVDPDGGGMLAEFFDEAVG